MFFAPALHPGSRIPAYALPLLTPPPTYLTETVFRAACERICSILLNTAVMNENVSSGFVYLSMWGQLAGLLRDA